MIRFSLAIPLRSGDFLIPALLPVQGVTTLADSPAADGLISCELSIATG